MSGVRPRKLAHVVYRTRRFTQMLAWYRQVFGATIQHQNPLLAFLTYDDEHHRFAFIDLAALQPDGDDGAGAAQVGVDHVAYTIGSLEELLANYVALKEQGILPYWCVHHGVTVSMYYADPDGNQMEFQVDAFAASAESNAFMRGPVNALNPVGVEYDPEDWLERIRAGTPVSAFLERRVHEQVSPVRGALARAFGPGA